ncbi:MAG: tetratricopeptide repeat protein [Planctomycetes bacterium]|nr:tetratricopeptide repeat protein [Planctomycetota bacterium]
MSRHVFRLSLFLALTMSATLMANPFEAADKLCMMERYHEALPIIKKAIAEHPDAPDGYMILAKIQFHLSRFSECRDSLRRATQLGGDPAAKWCSGFLARLEFWEGNDEKARQQLKLVDSADYVSRGLPVLLDATGMAHKRTPHYIVHVDAGLAAKGTLRAATEAMENVFEVYTKLFRFKAEPIISRVYLFGTPEAFVDFCREFDKEITPDKNSFYSRNYRVIVINCDPKGGKEIEAGITDSVQSTFYFQGFMQFVDMHCPGLPEWFEQGVSAYVSESEFVDGKPKVGTFRRKEAGDSPRVTRYERIKQALRDSACLPLNSLLTMEQKEFQDPTNNRFNVNTAHAWSFVHFLLHAKKFAAGKKLLSQFFMEMREGRTDQEAFAHTFGAQDLRKMEDLWRDYVNGL